MFKLWFSYKALNEQFKRGGGGNLDFFITFVKKPS